MKMYSEDDVKCIVEEFLAEYLNMDFVGLSSNSVIAIRRICSAYGIEIKDIKKNYD